jgi:acetylornithine aminotransferase
MAAGLLLVPAGPRVVRFVPPLVIRPRQIRRAVKRLEKALASLA